MSRWFRHYAGMMADPKFGGIARRCRHSRANVLFVWGMILESAAEKNSDEYELDEDAAGELLGLGTEGVHMIHREIERSGLVAEGRVVSWNERQFVSDTSTERSRKYRERSRNGDATLQQQAGDETQRPHRQRHSTETDTSSLRSDVAPPPEKPASKPKALKGTRWPSDATVPDDWLALGAAKRSEHGMPPIDLKLEAERFGNYWAARAGPGAIHVDWKKTWVNWVTSEKQRNYRNGSGNGSQKLPTAHDSFLAGVGELISEIRGEGSG